MSDYRKPYRSEVTISAVRRVWHRLQEKFVRNPRTADRLFSLFLGDGVSGIMSDEGLFLCQDFNKLCCALSSKKPAELIRAVRESGVFTLGLSLNSYGLAWFASPLYVNEKLLKKEMEEYVRELGNQGSRNLGTKELRNSGTLEPWNSGTLEPWNLGTLEPWNSGTLELRNSGTPDLLGTLWQTAPSQGPTVGHYTSIISLTGVDNIILTGSTHAALDGDMEVTTRQGPPAQPAKVEFRMPSIHEREEEVDRFINQIRTDRENFSIFERLMEILKNPTKQGIPLPDKAVTHEEAKEIIQKFMYGSYRQDMIESEKFFRYPGFSGRRNWLYNYLYCKKGLAAIEKLRTAAINRRHRQVSDKLKKAVQAERMNRPHSPHEWLSTDGHRLYEDTNDGITEIPEDAPPRPSSTAHWNKFSLEWYE